MASEKLLQELFSVAKKSVSFKGFSDKEIWDSCLAYKDRSDDDILKAMDKIERKDREALEKSETTQGKLKKKTENIKQMIEQEELERQRDAKKADELLEGFFN